MDQRDDDRRGSTRTALRVLGWLLVAVGLVFVVLAGMDFFRAMEAPITGPDDEPTRFWMFFVGLPLMAVGGWLLQAGYLGAVARFAARESADATRTTGRAWRGSGGGGGGGFCSQCGTEAEASDRFCGSCGRQLGAT